MEIWEAIQNVECQQDTNYKQNQCDLFIRKCRNIWRSSNCSLWQLCNGCILLHRTMVLKRGWDHHLQNKYSQRQEIYDRKEYRFQSRLVSYQDHVGMRLGSLCFAARTNSGPICTIVWYILISLNGVHISSYQQLTYLKFELDENRHHRLKCYYISANTHWPLLWESILLKVIPGIKKPS